MDTARLEELLEAFPDFRIDHDNAEHYAAMLHRELVVDRCVSCGRWRHPPSPVCPACWSTDMERSPVRGTGRVHLATVYHHRDPIRGGRTDDGVPMVTVVLDEQDDLVVTAPYVGEHPVTADQRVSLRWIEVHGHPFPAFGPEETT